MIKTRLKNILIKAAPVALIFSFAHVNADGIDQKVDALLAKMTLAEKIGQMNQYNGFYDSTGPAPSEGDAKNKYKHLKQGLVGSVLNVSGADAVRELQKVVVEESRLGIPLMFALDVIHGHRTVFPIPLAEAASWDLEAIENGARVSAIEASARGINWTFAPMVDISRDARWGRVMEGGGEDPYLSAQVGVARVKGFQGDDLSRQDTMIATAKHFAGYGFSEGGRDYNTVDLSHYTLYNTVFPPFKAAVDAGVRVVMNGFNTVDGVPATGNEFLQRGILKGQWGFEGFVVSDWGSITEMIPHGSAKDLKHAAELAVNAGSDVDMESYAYVKHLEALVKEGKVDGALIDDAARRILRTKFELGLFEDPYRYVSKEREEKLLYHKDHLAAARDMARKSIVLLKNDQNLLPLSPKQKKIAVIGSLANDKNSPLGSWRFGSEDNTAISLVEGLKAQSDNISYERGPQFVVGQESFLYQIEVNEADATGIEEAVKLAKESDVVVMMLGEHGFQSGEGRSRTDLGFPGMQDELLRAVHAVNQNIVLVVSAGRPLTLTWEDEHIPSIVLAWQLGTQSGHALADVIFGDYNPSGKLPVSFHRSIGQMPLYYSRLNTGRPKNDANMIFWSHYIDESNDALFPFGHGLSYTSFAYSNLKVDASDKKAIKVSVDVKNTGKRDGEEVVQLYIRDLVSTPARPIKELKGFDKLMIKAGKTKKVNFTLTEKELGFYDYRGNFIVQPGEFNVMVGGSSEDTIETAFKL